jgi:hypothetical protein
MNASSCRAPQWVALSLINWFGDVNTNERYLLEIIRKGRRRIDRIIPHEASDGSEAGKEKKNEGTYDSEEFLEVYPEWRAPYAKVEKSYAAFVSEVESVYARLREISDRAQFAREVKQYFFYGIMLAWKSEEEDRRAQREGKNEGAKHEREAEKSEWKGIDGWEYYGAWGVKRLIKDMRELEETGSRLKSKGAARRHISGH